MMNWSDELGVLVSCSSSSSRSCFLWATAVPCAGRSSANVTGMFTVCTISMCIYTCVYIHVYIYTCIYTRVYIHVYI